MWLRNPFPKLDHGDGEDLILIFNGEARDYVGNKLNTGFFFFMTSNGRTAAGRRRCSTSGTRRAWPSPGMKEQDVLNLMKRRGAFRRLGVRARPGHGALQRLLPGQPRRGVGGHHARQLLLH